MRKMFLLGVLALMVTGGVFWSCQKDDVTLGDIALKSASVDLNDDDCVIEYQLIAGQKYPVGTIKITVINDILEVEYLLDPGYSLINSHLWIGTNAALVPGGEKNPSPGLFKFNDLYKTGNVYIIPLSDLSLSCGDNAVIYAHATVGNESLWGVKTNTAWSNVNDNKKGSWGTYSTFQVTCCEPPAGSNECYKGETAWTAGSRYVSKGNWATYTAYDGVEKTVDLLAAQTKLAGTVTFSAPVDGNVTITVNFNYGWQFQNVTEYLKVQDYPGVPLAENPNPGGFSWKISTGNSIVVPVNNYYGVHVDVEGLIICPPTSL